MDATEANRRFYAETALEYDATEGCVVDSHARNRLLCLLDIAITLLPPEPRALDACGGSGNASLALLDRGIVPVTVDVSPDMLAIYKRKAAGKARVVEADIERFLELDERTWDLIIFSSALHHLDRPVKVAAAAARRLAPGGVLLTTYDPILTSAVGKRLRRADYVAHLILRHPDRVFARLRRGVGSENTIAATAERWANEGLDDRAVAAAVKGEGCEIVRHDLHYGGRFRLTGTVARALRVPGGFSLIAQRHTPRSVAES